MEYSQEHLKTMVYAEFGGQTECIMGNWKIENTGFNVGGKTRNISFSNRFAAMLHVLLSVLQ